MAVREVLTYPDPVLKQVCTPAQPEDYERVVTDLLDTMASFDHCVGLAAPQIGETVRIAVVDISAHPRAKDPHGLMVLVNPRVVARSEGSKVSREGCLSLPDLTANVRRPRKVTVEFTGLVHPEGLDSIQPTVITPSGEGKSLSPRAGSEGSPWNPGEFSSHRLEFASFEARCVLHEIDHLDGILFLDRVASITDDLFRRQTYR